MLNDVAKADRSRTLCWVAALCLTWVAAGSIVYLETTRSGSWEGKRLVPTFAGGEGGNFLNLARKLDDISSKDKDSRIRLVAMETHGSLANLAQITNVENALSFTFVLLSDYAEHKETYDSVRAVAILESSVIQVIARKASGITRLDDLKRDIKGKPRYRVYVGLSQSGTRQAARQVLRAVMGVQPPFSEWFSEWEAASEHLDFAAAAGRLRAGLMDAAIFAASPRAPAIQALLTAVPGDFDLISLDEPIRGDLAHDGRYRAAFPTPDGNSMVLTVGDPVMIATNKRTEVSVVQEIVKLLDDHATEIRSMLNNSVWLQRHKDPPLDPAGDAVDILKEPLITDPEKINVVTKSSFPLHQALVRSWLSPHRRWFVASGLFLAAQMFLLARIRPRNRPGGGDVPGDEAAKDATKKPPLLSPRRFSP